MLLETNVQRWNDLRNLNGHHGWEKRSHLAAQCIPNGSNVLDIGCGSMYLKTLLPPQTKYLSCDLYPREPDTQVCDLNQGQVPLPKNATIITLLGVIEYLIHPFVVLKKLCDLRLPLLFSYHFLEHRGNLNADSNGWLNQISYERLELFFLEQGYAFTMSIQTSPYETLVLAKSQKPVPLKRTKNVCIVSYNNVTNFGDRLGFHLLNQILPVEAEITMAHFKPWDVPNKEFDLLILGIGNSLFQPLLTENLVELLKRTPKTIGIFGTQYREEICTKDLGAVLENIDHWFARSQEDILLYGNLCPHVHHLGDWLIEAFPMATSTEKQTLTIGKEIWANLPLDRTIQHIQKFKTVISSSLHPLLCAMTSAEKLSYHEQYENQQREPSGKFRSLLIDIFHYAFPENTLFANNRSLVRAYKQRVRDNMQTLKEVVHSTLL